jgi:hypothetical protein
MGTSIENRTPPIGDPKATATPAALAAVMISLILPVARVRRWTHYNYKERRYLDCEKSAQRDPLPMTQCSKRHALMVLLCPQRAQMLSPGAVKGHFRE